ncbi:DUF2867 domain-containing protein, partial [Vibrio sp. 1865]
KDHGDERELDITAWWHPQGFLGLLYWFAMMPAHLFIFKGMVKAIAKEAESISIIPQEEQSLENLEK